jgi:hypothetical protein
MERDKDHLTSQLESLAADIEKTIAQAVNQEQLSADEVYAALNPVAEHLRELAGHEPD